MHTTFEITEYKALKNAIGGFIPHLALGFRKLIYCDWIGGGLRLLDGVFPISLLVFGDWFAVIGLEGGIESD